MTIYDISNEMFSANFYPGDPKPSYEPILSLEKNDNCNLTKLFLGTHSGTHMDAPSHFCKDAKTIDQVNLELSIGPCTVIEHNGLLRKREIETIASISKKRLLLKGNPVITLEAAKAMVEYEFCLLGVEDLTVGTKDTSKEVHLTLLEAEIAIVENLNLKKIVPGEYFLMCAPLKLGGLDGAPCRPVLLK